MSEDNQGSCTRSEIEDLKVATAEWYIQRIMYQRLEGGRVCNKKVVESTQMTALIVREVPGP